MKSLVLLLIFAVLWTVPLFAQQSGCDYKVEILTNAQEFKAEEFKFRIKATKVEGVPTNITGSVQITDSNGKIIKNYKPWKSEPVSRQKTSSVYSPNLKEGEEYRLIAEVNVDCDDSNRTNNADSKIIRIIKIKNETEEVKNNTTVKIKIPDAIDSKPANNISIQMEVKEQQKRQISNQSSNEEFDNIIRLHSTHEISSQLQATAAAVQESEEVYKSGSEKSKEMIILFLLVISILLNVVLIWKR